MRKPIKEYGSEFDWEANCPFLSGNASLPDWGRFRKYFRSGRDALRGIARQQKPTHRYVLLPALCCDSMVVPFEQEGYRVRFYRLNAALQADVDHVKQMACDQTVLVYMNYFGIESFSGDSLSMLKTMYPNMILLQDRTHDFLEKTSEEKADYLVVSIRKWAAVPDGGIAFSTMPFTVSTDKNDAFFKMRLQMLCHKSEYLRTGDRALKDRFRREQADATAYLDASRDLTGISSESERIVESLDYPTIARIRGENIAALTRLLTGARGVEPLSGGIAAHGLYYPILVHGDRAGLQKTLAEQNIYCPVIWPLRQQAQAVCDTARTISQTMLAVPCDQRYNTEDMAYIGQTIIRIMG